MNPACTAAVAWPTAAGASPHSRSRSPSTALPANQSEVPANWETTMTGRMRRGRARPSSLISVRYVFVELVHPHVRVAVRRCAPVAARREVAARDDLRPVRQRRALVLADLEEPEQKHAQPFLDVRE